jgi:hypothetical protein
MLYTSSSQKKAAITTTQGNVTARELEHWFFASNPRLKQVR